MFSLKFSIALAIVFVGALVSAFPLPAYISPSSVSLRPIAPSLRPVPAPSSVATPKPSGVLLPQGIEDLIEDLDLSPNTQFKREKNGPGPVNIKFPIIPSIVKDVGIDGKSVKRETTGTAIAPLTSLSDTLNQSDLESKLENNTVGGDSPNSSEILQIVDSIKNAFQVENFSKRE